MARAKPLAAAALLALVLVISGCSDSSNGGDAPPAARLVAVAGTPFKKIVLTQAAATRIGVRTAPTSTKRRASRARTLDVPYAAVVYDPSGAASVYTSLAARTYIRRPVLIDEVSGSTAFLKRGPAVGTPVVVVGAAELFGVETGVQGE